MIWFAIVAAVIALDRVTKLIVMSKMQLGESVKVIGNLFNFTYLENRGAAWSMFQNGRYFFIVLTIIVTAAMIYILYKKADNKLLKFSLSLVIGGAVGNLIDRIYKGSVTDFLQVFVGPYRDFPIFNVADSFVCIGTALLAYYLLFIYKEKEKEPKKAEE